MTKTNKFNEMDDEEIHKLAEHLDEKYKNDYEYQERTDTHDRGSMLPTLADPILWLVKCKQGSEREA